MVNIGVEHCNPGRIAASVSRFQGEVVTEDVKTIQDLERCFDGQRKNTKHFAAECWGYRAIFLMLHNYEVLYGLNTIGGLINRWCVGRDINRHRYAKAIAQRLECNVQSLIDTTNESRMIAMVSSMSRIENGVPADMESGHQIK